MSPGTNVQQVTGEIVLRSLQNTGLQISSSFDAMYSDDLKAFAFGIADYYNYLQEIINRDGVSDADFQSALLFWTGLNTLMASMEILRRGYTKEPNVLLRSALEIFAAAHHIHVDPTKYAEFAKNNGTFDSTKSISAVTNIHPFIGRLYGGLSDMFTHVSSMHSLPHLPPYALAVGGVFDEDKQEHAAIILAGLLSCSDVLGSILEITMIEYIPQPKHWTKSNGGYHFSVDQERGEHYIRMIQGALEKIDREESIA